MRLELCQGDCMLWLDQLRDEKISCIFADPPDNIGLGYENYEDKLADQEYETQLWEWTKKFITVSDIVWISFNAKWTITMGKIAHELLGTFSDDGLEVKPCVQTFSFYQLNKNDLGNAHRPLWRFRKNNAPLYPEQIKVQSWRQRHGDKRATAGGKVPGDSFDFTKLPERQHRDWHERAIKCGDWVVDPLIPDDHFDFTRVTGNSKQRRPYHPTQLNEGLVERCVALSTKEGDWVVDPFGGTGTTMRVCRKINRSCTLVEIDPTYCKEIATEHGLKLREKGKLARWELTASDS